MVSADDKLVRVKFLPLLVQLWPVLRHYRAKFTVAVVLILSSTVIEITLPILVGRTVDLAIGLERNKTALFWLCGAFLLLVIVKALLESAQAFVIQSTGQSVTHELRVQLLDRLTRLPVAYFDRNPSGRLVTRVVNDIKSLSELFTASIAVLALDVMIILGTVAAMFWVDFVLASWVLATFPLVFFSIRFFGTRLAESYRRVRARLAAINAFLGENIGAIATIQRLGAENERNEKFKGTVDVHHDSQMETLRVFAYVQPVANVLNGVSMGALLITGGHLVLSGKITVGILVAFLGYLRNLFQPIRDLVEKYNTFLSSMVSAERIVGILNEKVEGEDEPFVSKRVVTFDPPGEISSEIEFKNVSFHYPTRKESALRSVSFKVPAGASLAIVGPTGSGKSTIIRLLMRFYEPDSGSILFGDRMTSKWDRVSLRRQIGVVHQDIYLFQGNIRENLRLGRNDLTDDILISQLERAQMWNFIKDRGGLEMQVLEGGVNLSVGEKQLLSFARVMIFDPAVLVLDEATASIDRIVERRLLEAIHEILQQRTSIVIAHRLSTIRRCDNILVLEHGRVVEEGTYSSLLEQPGLFRTFHEIHSEGR